MGNLGLGFSTFLGLMKPLSSEELQKAVIVTDYQKKETASLLSNIDEKTKSQYEQGEGARKFIKYGTDSAIIIILGLAAYGSYEYYKEKKAVDYGLNCIDKGSQQEEVLNNTQEELQNSFAVDTSAIIDNYKDNLTEEELEDFEGFSRERQQKTKENIMI